VLAEDSDVAVGEDVVAGGVGAECGTDERLGSDVVELAIRLAIYSRQRGTTGDHSANVEPDATW